MRLPIEDYQFKFDTETFEVSFGGTTTNGLEKLKNNKSFNIGFHYFRKKLDVSTLKDQSIQYQICGLHLTFHFSFLKRMYFKLKPVNTFCLLLLDQVISNVL
jgi:hypothetical protein